MPIDAAHLAAICCLLTLLVCVLTADAADPVCKKKLSPCSCETVTGGKIDLSPLAKTGSFAFTGRGPGTSSYLYQYNPCIGVSCDTSSGGAAACQQSTDGKFVYLLGTQDTALFATHPDVGLHVTYSAVSGDKKRRSALVLLVCDTSGIDSFTPLDEGSVGPQPIVYRMQLKSRHCCEQSGGGGGGGSSSGLSGGDILLILFFSLAFVYVAGGIAVNRLIRGQRSFPEVLPNRSFWAALPALVRDGAAFSFNRVRSAVTKNKSGYENI